MDKYRVLEIKESVFESNDREAEKLRGELKDVPKGHDCYELYKMLKRL